MSGRRGAALLTTLWVLTMLSAVAAAALTVTRLGSGASQNRVLLLRGAWAREACAEILLARYAERGAMADLETVDLGRGTWCRARVEDAAGKLDLNRAPGDMLRAMLGSDSLADAVLDWRDGDDVPRQSGAEAKWYESRARRTPRNSPLADVSELGMVAGFDSARVAALRALVTVRGAELINVNAAPAEVLEVLPGLGPEAVSLILRRREAGQRISSSDELLSLLSGSARQTLTSQYQQFTLQAGYMPSRLVISVEGGVTGHGPVSAVRLTLVPMPQRLAVVRREGQ